MKRELSSKEAVALLLKGGVGVMATDTVYGLVARAADRQAVARMYALKQREHKPGTVIAASVDQLGELGVPVRYLDRVKHLWPNPLSIEISLEENLSYLHQETGRQAFRVVKDPAVRGVLKQTGPLVTSSANQPGEPGAVSIGEAQAYFDGEVDFYVDSGDLSGRAPSTIIRLVADSIEVIRQGALEIDADGWHTIKANRPECPFCRSNGVLKGEVLFAGNGAYLVEASTATGCYLIIPETHIETLEELPDTWWADLKQVLVQVPRARDYNLSVNLGKAAGQTLNHLHFWVVPRVGGRASSGKGLARLVFEADAV